MEHSPLWGETIEKKKQAHFSRNYDMPLSPDHHHT